MMSNIEKYAELKGISSRDAQQTFMQVVTLKNLSLREARLIGGTALVIGHGNPRFSEDIDLSQISAPEKLAPFLGKAARELQNLLGLQSSATPPKEGGLTWCINCRQPDGSQVRLHIDSQPYHCLSSHPVMVEYPGIAPFVFPSIEMTEIIADKLIAIAFRKYLGGRDIFDLWYHRLKTPATFSDQSVMNLVTLKLKMRRLRQKDFMDSLNLRLGAEPSKRVIAEWSRYLPHGLRDARLFREIYAAARDHLLGIKL